MNKDKIKDISKLGTIIGADNCFGTYTSNKEYDLIVFDDDKAFYIKIVKSSDGTELE